MSGPKERTIRVHVSLPAELVERIDGLVGPRRRSAFIADAASMIAKRDYALKVLRETAGTLDLKRHPEWSTPEKVSKWVHDQRRIPSVRNDPMEAAVGRLPARRGRRDRVAKAKVKIR